MKSKIAGWVFGIIVFAVGVLNLILVHPVPGLIYMLLSLIYFPQANIFLQKNIGFRIPWPVKLILGVMIFFFTLGVSDLGDMID